MMNTVLIAGSFVFIAIILFILYQRAKMRTTIVIEDDYSTIDEVVEAVKIEMVEIVKEDETLNISDAEYNALYKRKARITSALKNCVHGIDSAKIIVIELIRSFIDQNVPKSRIAELLGLSDGMLPSDHVMFEILLYRYKKEFGKQAIAEILEKYHLADERPATHANRPTDVAYYFTIKDLHEIYEKEAIELSDSEIVDIMSIIVYQRYKGFGILDTLREMDINGINCGTSGSIMSNAAAQRDGTLKATNSVWVYYKGKYIHFRFLSFGSEEELRRIVQLIARYNSPGPLTAKRGYLVNTMYDKSRVLALRPPASEYWAVFIRKFTISDPTPKALIIKDYTKRGDLPIRLMEFLLRGQMTCAFTGRQGSGKTTMMSSVIRFIDPRFTIRILEMAPELYLREIYPSRNILSLQETADVTASELQDALKKSDAAVSIVGEVATDAIAARMIQMGMTASMFTIFSHHANTAEKLVYTLRNSLVNAGGFNDMKTAADQVMEVVKFDIHLDYTPEGERFIERITEIIPLDESQPYPEYDPNDPEHSMNRITREYYTRQTDRINFITRDILTYDKRTHTYHVANRISPELESLIRNNLGELRHEYDKFIFSEWGRRPAEDHDKDEVTHAMMTYYRDLEISKQAVTESSTLQDIIKPLETLQQRRLRESKENQDRPKGSFTIDITEQPEETEEPSFVSILPEEQRTGLTLSDMPVEKQHEVLQEIIKEEDKLKSEEVAAPPEEDLGDIVEEVEENAITFEFYNGEVNI